VEFLMSNGLVLNAARVAAAAVVAVGAGLLDIEMPSWWETADLTTLDQADPQRCVLAQTYGGTWLDGVQALFPRLTVAGQFMAAERAGFWVNDGQPDVEASSEACLARYQELTEQWRAAVVARRATWR
jgi:hypothetical protein